MEESPQHEEHQIERWTMLRDIGVLQVKLIVDSLRDLLLVPLSLIAGVISLATGENGRPGPHFYRLIAWGKQSELWINLFGAIKNAPEEVVETLPFGDTDIDKLVGRLETIVVDEVKRGGVTAQAKNRLDKLLDALQKKRSEGTADPDA